MPTATHYGDLAEPISSLAYDLSNGRLAFDRPCHLDPDIDASELRQARLPGWRGSLTICKPRIRRQGDGIAISLVTGRGTVNVRLPKRLASKLGED